MLHYMQMKNWFIIFVMATLVYMVQQKIHHRGSNNFMSLRAQNSINFTSIFQ